MNGYHPLLWLGPAVVLRPADCDLRKPSSIWSKRVVCSSICLLNLICPLKIFFMPSHMEDMKALESVGRGCCQKAGSSSSSKSSSEEDSAWASSGWKLGVQTAWRQLLYALVARSGATNTRLYESKTSSGKKFLRRRVTNTGCEYLAPLVPVKLVMRQR